MAKIKCEVVNKDGKVVSRIPAAASMNTIYNNYNKYCKRVAGDKAKLVEDGNVLGNSYWTDGEQKWILRRVL